MINFKRLDEVAVYDMYGQPLNYYVQDGFVFTLSFIRNDGLIFDRLLIRNPSSVDAADHFNYPASDKSLEEHIQFTNEHQIEKAEIIAESLEFITQCPSLRDVYIIPASTAKDNFDYSPLYEMPCLRHAGCPTEYIGDKGKKHHTTIDLSRINGLTRATIRNKRDQNFNHASDLKEITMYQCKDYKTLDSVCSGIDLKRLELIRCNTQSLQGIEQLNHLEELSMEEMRSLEDIAHLEKIAGSLKLLHINNCPKINSYTFLHKMTNLESLSLNGGTTLPDLSFLDAMPKLEMFCFSFKIADGDLTRCLQIPYVNSKVDRRNYNLKNQQLPKNECKYINNAYLKK